MSVFHDVPPVQRVKMERLRRCPPSLVSKLLTPVPGDFVPTSLNRCLLLQLTG